MGQHGQVVPLNPKFRDPVLIDVKDPDVHQLSRSASGRHLTHWPRIGARVCRIGRYHVAFRDKHPDRHMLVGKSEEVRLLEALEILPGAQLAQPARITSAARYR